MLGATGECNDQSAVQAATPGLVCVCGLYLSLERKAMTNSKVMMNRNDALSSHTGLLLCVGLEETAM